MINITIWTALFLEKLKTTFGDRIWFAGLQGSYGRGEATESSDIDLVVILNELRTEDLDVYNEMLDSLPHRELVCGFLSGKKELLNWEASDLFQFYYDTKPLIGSLDELQMLLDDDAVKRAIKIGACNIYHGCVHNMLYDRSDEILRNLYKSAAFVVRAISFRRTGVYTSKLTDLMKIESPEERAILDTAIYLKNNGPICFEEMSRILFLWSQKWIIETQ